MFLKWRQQDFLQMQNILEQEFEMCKMANKQQRAALTNWIYEFCKHWHLKENHVPMYTCPIWNSINVLKLLVNRKKTKINAEVHLFSLPAFPM